MRLYSILFITILFICESAFAGILIRTPRGGANGGLRTRLSTTAQRSTNPPMEYRPRTNDVTYYFNFKRAEAQYAKDLLRWQRDRQQQLARLEKEKERSAANKRRTLDSAAARMVNASSTTRQAADPKELSRDPRAWFNSKIAGSFGPRPSSKQSAPVFDSGDKPSVTKQSKSSSALLEGTPDASDEAVRKEGLWSKFLRVLGLKK